jgi:hypothetical protein
MATMLGVVYLMESLFVLDSISEPTKQKRNRKRQNRIRRRVATNASSSLERELELISNSKDVVCRK